MKREIPELLQLVATMPYRCEGEDATEKKQLFHARIKERMRKDQQRATLFNVDEYLRQAEEAGVGIAEAAGEGDGFTGIKAAIQEAAENADVKTTFAIQTGSRMLASILVEFMIDGE